MGLFTRNWNKPGKGVDPNEPPKRSFFRFFDIFFRKFWHFVRINLLYVVALIPTFVLVFILSGFVSGMLLQVTGITMENYDAVAVATTDFSLRLIITFLFAILLGMGPATAGISYLLRNFAREEHAWIWSDFKDAVKGNWKQATLVFIIDLVVVSLLYIAILFYAQVGGMLGLLQYPMITVAIIYIIMHFYLYPLMVTFELSLKNLYKNALIFALGKLPSNLLVLILLLAIPLLPLYLGLMYGGQYAMIIILVELLLFLFILLSFCSFIVSFNAYPKMKKYMLVDTTVDVKPDVPGRSAQEDDPADTAPAEQQPQVDQGENPEDTASSSV